MVRGTVSAKKEQRNERSVPMKKSGIVKSTTNAKESDRITRLKAARSAYSKLSQERAAKRVRTPPRTVPVAPKLGRQRSEAPQDNPRPTPSPSRAVPFKPMESSLAMIENNSLRMPNTGRASSIGGARSLAPRPSLLPLGINVFDTNVSVNDKLKVRDFVSSLRSATATPKRSTFGSDRMHEMPSAHTTRTVRFFAADTIQEQRESGGEEILQAAVPEKDNNKGVELGAGDYVPHSILKKKQKKEAVFSSPAGVSSASSRNRRTSNESAISQAYTLLFNTTDADLKKTEPIMIDQMIELLNDMKSRRVCSLSSSILFLNAYINTSFSLLSLPEDLSNVPKPNRRGFRKITPRNSSSDLQANQEVMLINEAAKTQVTPSPSRVSRLATRLRLKDPVSSTLGGDSPFMSINASPFF
ncbi:hypothetical protein Q1695_015796 [Nippostrongylus brasiliensis]|nr:hypothetical protein Q1695_015796 [Nippostrongylus brasiliensis]